MAMSAARVLAPTHSSSWVTTCTSSNGTSTTHSRERGGSLHPVIQAGRTADRSAVLSWVQNVNHTLAAADFGAVICHITRKRGCRRGDGLPRLRKGPRDFRVAAAQLRPTNGMMMTAPVQPRDEDAPGGADLAASQAGGDIPPSGQGRITKP